MIVLETTEEKSWINSFESQGAEELFVMANRAKILLPNERVAFV